MCSEDIGARSDQGHPPRTSLAARWRFKRAAGSATVLVALAAVGCGDGTGGLTARLEFSDVEDAPDRRRRALRTAEVPDFIDRLQILALDTDGSTLAETNLFISPAAGQLQLFPEGGTWSLTDVPAGANRRLAGRAYLGASLDPRLDQALVYTGALDGIEVIAGQTTNAGVLVLRPGPNRIPEADFDPPPPPVEPVALPLPAGNQLEVTFSAPAAEDIAGYLVAVADGPTTGVPPAPPRSMQFTVGMPVEADSAYRVTAVTNGPAPQPVILTDLANGVPAAILVYAFDGDALGRPLNFSPPALLFGTPQDILSPGPATSLASRLLANEMIEFTFVAPGEDGPTDSQSAPERYEVRTADSMRPLVDPAEFSGQAGVQAPAVAPPGQSVRFTRTAEELGLAPGGRRFVGIRAVDDSANPGPAAIIEVTLTSSLAPAIAAVQPSVALAGQEVLIRGAGFGDEPGVVTLAGTESTTVTFALTVARWAETEILVVLPTNAATGEVTVVRPDGPSVQAFLTVIARVDDELPADSPPFGFVAEGAEGRVAALYRESGFSSIEGAIERFVDNTAEGTPWSPVSVSNRSEFVAGTKNRGRFVFVTSNPDGELAVMLVSSSTTASADPFRQTASLGPDSPDSLDLAALPTTDERVPAVVVFTLQGTLRTGNVDDARLDAFNLFFPVSSTVASYDHASIAVSRNGSAVIAHRTVTSTDARLTVRRSATASPGSFVEDSARGPLADDGLRVRAVPDDSGRFVVAYHHVGSDGQTRIRLLDVERFGMSDGVAPMIRTDLRLQDIGWVTRRSDVYVVIAAVSTNPGPVELVYTEMPLSALDGSPADGQWPSTILDVARPDTRARLGCGFDVGPVCPLAWMGDNVGLLFVRR